MDCLTFLARTAKLKPQPLFVLHGDEDFLKRLARAALLERLLGDADPDLAVSSYPGDKTELAAVRDELATLPFLSPLRIVIVEQADPFVTRYRPALETLAGEPAKTGVLILDVKSFPANTKLAKAVPDAAQIACKAPPRYKLPQWCTDWAKDHHGKALDARAAQLLVELVGEQMGLLAAELAKLATASGTAKAIRADDVDRLVGRSREADTFKIFDAIGSGDAAAALAILDRLFEQGSDPLQILGAFSWQLRRLAAASRLSKQNVPLRDALDQIGVPPFAREGCEKQLRHLGWRRLEKLYDWLIETDLGLKGGNPLPPRVLLERLIVRLARPREEAK